MRVDVPCDAPFAATFDVMQNGRKVASFQSNGDGQFTVALPPGDYVVIPASDAPLMRPTTQTKTVSVGPTGRTTVQLDFDTGIR